MKPIFRLCLLAAVLAVASTTLIYAPDCLAAGCEGSYTSGPSPSAWGKGADCTAARNDLRSKLNAQANYACQGAGYDVACDLTVVETSGCYLANGQYVIDGYRNHGCANFFSPPQP